MKTKLPVLTLKGSPHQIGYKHGKKARLEIVHNLEVYFRRFKSETELSHDVALSRAAKFLDVINKGSPEYGATMKGVAAGSGQEILDITALNVRYELMYSQFSKIGLKPVPKTFGCTAFAAVPSTVENGHLMLGNTQVENSRTCSQSNRPRPEELFSQLHLGPTENGRVRKSR